DTPRPLSPNDPDARFDTPLLETRFAPSAFFLTLLEILFSVNHSAECGVEELNLCKLKLVITSKPAVPKPHFYYSAP
ncbi:MAG: hypothetical protein ACXVDN_06910, partial [Ktedonobacteraceae bacterium]